MDTVAPMPANADWQDHASRETQMGTTTTTTTSTSTTTTPQGTTAAKKQRPPVMVLTGSYTTPVIVGRGSQATLNLGRINKQVSRRHAIIEWHASSAQFRISVLGQNGVRINGVGYPSGQQCLLKRGDVVDLVGVKMVFKTPSSPPPAQSFSSNNNNNNSVYHHSQDLGHHPEQDENLCYDALSPLKTPTKKQQHPFQHLPQSPASSPARFTDSMPSSPVAARMLQKMLKYESRSGAADPLQQHLQSPPPSDPPTDLGYMPSSPIKSRPLFEMARESERMSALHHPSSHHNEQEQEQQQQHHHHTQQHHIQQKHQQHHQQQQRLDADNNVFLARTPLATLQIDSPSSNRHGANNAPIAVRAETVVSGKLVMDKEEKKKEEEKEAAEMKKKKELKEDAKVELNKHVTTKAVKKQDCTTTPKAVKKQNDGETPSTIIDTTSKKTASVKKDKAEDSVKAQKKSSSSSSATKSSTHSRTADSVESESHTKKKKKQQQKHQDEDEDDEQKTVSKSEKKKNKKSSNESSPQEDDKEQSSSSTSPASSKPKTDYTEMIIDTLVFARKKKSMTLSELYDEMMVSQPSLVKSQDPVEFKEELLRCLSGAKCVGKIVRKGKDAYNKPLESQWYYIPEMDHNVMRKLTRQEVMPSARKCTLKDKQYFFKMPPKLPYHRKSTSPYAVKPSRAKDVRLELTDDADADNRSSSSSSSSESDSEGEPLALVKKATIEKRKRGGESTLKNERRSRPTANQSKKRRTDGAAPSSSSLNKKQQSNQRDDNKREDEDEEEEEEDEDEDESEDEEVDQDSLDDLSELSGLEDHDN
ncbi:hypothetical protein BGW41_000516 [Actinomortierella wolfii]|nr:hypothetical protein BGW41_000516 [Actinomortierella wolfii]